jgi:hypothetical protein
MRNPHLAGVYLFPVQIDEQSAQDFAATIKKLNMRGVVVPAIMMRSAERYSVRIDLHPESAPTDEQSLYDVHYHLRRVPTWDFLEEYLGEEVLDRIEKQFHGAPFIYVTLVKHRETFYAKASVYLDSMPSNVTLASIKDFDRNHITTIYCSRLLDMDVSHTLEKEDYPLDLPFSTISTMTTDQINAYAMLRNVMYSLSKRIDRREQEIAVSLLRYFASTGQNFLTEIDGKLLGFKNSQLIFADNSLRCSDGQKTKQTSLRLLD